MNACELYVNLLEKYSCVCSLHVSFYWLLTLSAYFTHTKFIFTEVHIIQSTFSDHF